MPSSACIKISIVWSCSVAHFVFIDACALVFFTLSLHDALPIFDFGGFDFGGGTGGAGGGASFRDLFSQFFGARGGHVGGPEHEPGGDLEYQIEIEIGRAHV